MTRIRSNWRDTAACLTEDTDTFFPLGNGPDARAQERHAKAICFSCPSIEQCGQWALDNRVGSGVWGGLSGGERRTLLRRRGVRLAADPDTDPDTDAEPRQARPTTLRGAWEQYTRTLPDGHLAWTSSRALSIDGRVYTPHQIAYALDRGHAPDGVVQRMCDVQGCVLPAHLADTAERALLRRTGATTAAVA